MFRRVVTAVVLLLFIFSATGSAAKRSKLIVKFRDPAAIEKLSLSHKFKLSKKLNNDSGSTYIVDHPDADSLRRSLEKDPDVEWVDQNETLSLVTPLASGETVLPLGGGLVSEADFSRVLIETLGSGETVLPLGSGETVLPLGSGETVLPLGSGETVLPLQEQKLIYASYLQLAEMLMPDPRFLLQTSFWKIGLYNVVPKASGKGVIVVNLDTGADSCHPALTGILMRSFVEEPLTPENCATDTTKVVPGFGHGTAVASLIRVIAPQATIWSYRVFDSSGTASTADVYEAIIAATDAGAQVINMSFGSDQYSSAMRDAIDYGSRRGVVFTAASGNDNLQKLMVPAVLDPVMAVASTNADGIKSWYSNYHTKMFVSSPGENLWAAYPNSKIVKAYGTSFASALVAGEAALFIDFYQRSNPRSPDAEIVRTAVKTGVDSIDSVNARQFKGKLGSGRIQLSKILSRGE